MRPILLFMKKYLLLLLFSLGVFVSPAEAAQTYKYGIYGGGFHVVDADMILKENKGTYDLTVKAITQGFLGRVAPWSSVMVSKGRDIKNNWQPDLFENVTVWRNDAKTTILKYNKNGVITDRIVKEQGKAEDTREADPQLAKNATDLPTGIMNFVRHRDLKQGCEGSFNVYDGKRRFIIRMAGQQNDVIKPNRYTQYAGPVISCTIEVIQDGGKWADENRGWFKIQEDARGKGGLPRVFLTPLNGQTWLVPVRMELSSPYGNFVMHLTQATR